MMELATRPTDGSLALSHFFFFQAEDGIRDYKLTGVQTCAIPISRLHGTFPTERSGFRQECRAWVKRSRSMITLLTRHAEPARVPCQGALMCQPLKPKQLTCESQLSYGRGWTQAHPFSGDRVPDHTAS